MTRSDGPRLRVGMMIENTGASQLSGASPPAAVMTHRGTWSCGRSAPLPRRRSGRRLWHRRSSCCPTRWYRTPHSPAGPVGHPGWRRILSGRGRDMFGKSCQHPPQTISVAGPTPPPRPAPRAVTRPILQAMTPLRHPQRSLQRIRGGASRFFSTAHSPLPPAARFGRASPATREWHWSSCRSSPPSKARRAPRGATARTDMPWRRPPSWQR